MQFTPNGGRVAIGCASHDDVVEISVTDSGIGIPADKLESIFEPFVQVDTRLTRVQDGVGLGLAISRDLARKVGGDLSVTSTFGEGACFTLSLPMYQNGATVTDRERSRVSKTARSVSSRHWWNVRSVTLLMR